MKEKLAKFLYFLIIVIPFMVVGVLGGIMLAYEEATSPWNEDNRPWEE